MITHNYARAISLAALLSALAFASGCHHYQQARALYQPPPAVAPMGAVTDAVWQSQEARAEASEFVIHEHDFTYRAARLNDCGMSHVRQIAARLMHCPQMPVVIEPSRSKIREETEFQYPVHPDPELDLRRREVVVLALQHFGVPDAEKRTVVAPAWAEGFTATEALRVYQAALSGGFGFGGGGAGFGGFGSSFGGGGFGGFGF